MGVVNLRFKMKQEFTKDEIRVLKEFAQEKLRVEEIFLKDEDGKKIPRGGYSGWAKAMRKGGAK